MKVRLDIAVPEIQIVNTDFPLIEWTYKRLLSELYRRYPVTNGTQTYTREDEPYLRQVILGIEAEWKEPVQ